MKTNIYLLLFYNGITIATNSELKITFVEIKRNSGLK